VQEAEAGRTIVSVELGGSAVSLEVLRTPQAGAPVEDGLGRVEADWTRPDGAIARGPVVLVR
jgi:hypothetical protein